MNPTDFRKTLSVLESIMREAGDSADDVLALKTLLSKKIKELPNDPETLAALQEIEDVLAGANAGGKVAVIDGELKSINDATVSAAHKELARYIVSLPHTTAQRTELFDLWRDDKIVDIPKLLSPGKKTFDEIISSYKTNSFTTELVNELMHISALGQGKGEFGLSALSKRIRKQEGKGDLSIDGRHIEVKTADGGAGRFKDQEVGPAPGFESAARELEEFVSEHPTTPMVIPTSGLKLTSAVAYYGMLDDKDKKIYIDLVASVITKIFGGTATKNTNDIMSAIKEGNEGAAIQSYVQANFDYYMGKKKDEGVLYLDVSANPIWSVYFKNADDLSKSALRLHASTAYITSVADARLPYPQVTIVDTTFGANAAAKAQKAASKQAASAAKAEQLKAKLANKGGGTSAMRPPGTVTPAASIDREVSAPRARK